MLPNMNAFKFPVMVATIERRLLVNWRVDPDVVAGMLPDPLRPQTANGYAVVGVCLIRLGNLRPAGMPGGVGMCTENAAHRVSVEWDEGGQRRHGVYIPRRHSASRATVALGGRVFPGVHRRASFDVRETGDEQRVAFRGEDVEVGVDLAVAQEWPGGRLFGDLAEASAFFAGGTAGYSTGRDPGWLDGLELRTDRWRVEPTVVRRATSTLLDALPTATFDHALLMRDLPATWHALPPLEVGTSGHWWSAA